jgi:endonuclease/exonuclease/phosphatase family metal-dependent hydrolase
MGVACTPGPTDRLESTSGVQVSSSYDNSGNPSPSPGTPDTGPLRDGGSSSPDEDRDTSTGSMDTAPPERDTAPDPPDLGPTVKLATWNIRAPSDGETKTDYIAQTARALKADVVALQELGENPPLDQLFPSSDYRTFVSNASDGQKLRVGFAVSKDLDMSVQRNGDFETLAIEPEQRRGVDVTLQFENHSLRMLSIHLNSGCQDGGSSDDCRLLEQQARELRSWIETREQNDQDYVVLGDFNRTYESGSEFWNTLESADDGMIVTSKNKSPRCLDGTFRQFIDHIVFDGDVSSWLQISDFQDLTYEEALNSDPSDSETSDHCPAFVEIAEKK